ncbi:MAG: hypothetical protein Q8L19_24975 [Reyranella sp.]|nr:hypothetical protein [Reyranella sp.]
MIGGLVSAAVGYAGGFAGIAKAQAGRPLLVLASDDTSEACKVWRTQWEPLFLASAAYKKLDYRVVNATTSALLSKQQTWPADLRWLLDTFLMSQVGVQEGFEVPRFFLVQNRQVTMSTAGNNAWRDAMWPTILDVTGTSP